MYPPISDPPEFTHEELQAALKRVGEEARRTAFAAGLPIMVARDARLILLYPDGAEKIVGGLHPQPDSGTML